MTDEQFAKMYAVEVAKLAMLQAIAINTGNIAVAQGKQASLPNWKDTREALRQAAAIASPPPQA